MTRNPLRAPKTGVQTLYTEQQVSTLIRAQKDAGMSLRVIAAEYGSPVNHADIERALQGRFPHDLDKRRALNLVPICAACGQKVHRARVVPEWVKQGAEFLASRETAPKKNEIRVYSRSGKRVSA
jgi:hypothetical protein